MKQRLFSQVMVTIIVLELLIVPTNGNSQVVDRENLKSQIERLAVLHQSGEIEDFINAAEERLATSEPNAETYFDLGMLLAVKALFGKDIQQAKFYWNRSINQLEKALELSPMLSEAHSVLGHLYICPFVEDKDALRKSKKHFEEALKLKPGEAVAQEGMKRLAFRSASTEDKKRVILNHLRDLSMVTRSGRKFSVILVKMEDSPLGTVVVSEIKLQDVSDKAIIDCVEEMRRVGGMQNANGASTTSKQIISSIIRMTTEACGVIYGAVHTIGLEAERVGVILQGPSKNVLRRVLVPCSLLEKLTTGQSMSEKELFGSMIYLNE